MAFLLLGGTGAFVLGDFWLYGGCNVCKYLCEFTKKTTKESGCYCVFKIVGDLIFGNGREGITFCCWEGLAH